MQLKKRQLTADQNAANQDKAAYENAQTVANEKSSRLAAAEAAKKKQKLQQLLQPMLAKDSQYRQSMSMLLRHMSQKQLQQQKSTS